uniref:Uncharacterized protein n=1 Tax=Timema douglasi TaxID=61478 RepID=A0A7R8VAR1_TIMDO|nr:unnamed protein product [Timema douglasi]
MLRKNEVTIAASRVDIVNHNTSKWHVFVNMVVGFEGVITMVYHFRGYPRKCTQEWKTICTPDRDSDLPVIHNLVYCESSALEHAAATEAVDPMRISGLFTYVGEGRLGSYAIKEKNKTRSRFCVEIFAKASREVGVGRVQKTSPASHAQSQRKSWVSQTDPETWEEVPGHSHDGSGGDLTPAVTKSSKPILNKFVPNMQRLLSSRVAPHVGDVTELLLPRFMTGVLTDPRLDGKGQCACRLIRARLRRSQHPAESSECSNGATWIPSQTVLGGGKWKSYSDRIDARRATVVEWCPRSPFVLGGTRQVPVPRRLSPLSDTFHFLPGHQVDVP